jgi:alpha-1,2-mannosyltransferase
MYTNFTGYSLIYKKIQITWSIILIMAYSLLFYAMWTHQLSTDFYSFYASTESWVQGMKPYSLLKIPYLAGEYGANLNPPIFLMLFAPLAKLTPQDSLMVWSSLSFILNLISASIAFNLAFSKHFFKQHRLMVYLVYLSLFSTLLNTGIAQTGAWLAFLLIAGYAAYKKNHYKVAAILWGIIIAIKLFPGLLFFYILRQRHYKMAGMMAITATLLWLLPALLYGPEIYLNYFKLLSHVYWYSDNWNASLYGTSHAHTVTLYTSLPGQPWLVFK